MVLSQQQAEGAIRLSIGVPHSELAIERAENALVFAMCTCRINATTNREVKSNDHVINNIVMIRGNDG